MLAGYVFYTLILALATFVLYVNILALKYFQAKNLKALDLANIWKRQSFPSLPQHMYIITQNTRLLVEFVIKFLLSPYKNLSKNYEIKNFSRHLIFKNLVHSKKNGFLL